MKLDDHADGYLLNEIRVLNMIIRPQPIAVCSNIRSAKRIAEDIEAQYDHYIEWHPDRFNEVVTGEVHDNEHVKYTICPFVWNEKLWTVGEHKVQPVNYP